MRRELERHFQANVAALEPRLTERRQAWYDASGKKKDKLEPKLCLLLSEKVSPSWADQYEKLFFYAQYTTGQVAP